MIHWLNKFPLFISLLSSDGPMVHRFFPPFSPVYCGAKTISTDGVINALQASVAENS